MLKFKKFDVKDIDEKYIVLCNHSYCEDDRKHCYNFINTPVGNVVIYSSCDFSNHDHALMILLELSHEKSDIWWCNNSETVDTFNKMCDAMLEDREYFKPMFKMCTEYSINNYLKYINNLIDYTDYWTEE